MVATTSGSDEGFGMPDFEDRLRAAELGVVKLEGGLTKHEAECALRYGAIREDIADMAERNDRNTEQIGAYIKWLAIAVGCLALVVVGAATIQDVVRGLAARVGVPVP